MEQFKRLIRYLFEHIIVYIPLTIIIVFSAAYVFLIVTSPISLERLKLLISLDAATATLSGLSLYASYTSQDENRKRTYYRCGEKLFHAFIYLFVATFIRSCILIIDDSSLFMIWHTPIQMILIGSTIIFFIYGISDLLVGLKRLLLFTFGLRNASMN